MNFMNAVFTAQKKVIKKQPMFAPMNFQVVFWLKLM